MGQKMKRRKELARPRFEGYVLENALRNPIAFWCRKQKKKRKRSPPKGLKNIPFTFEFVPISGKITFEFVSISGKNTFEFVQLFL